MAIKFPCLSCDKSVKTNQKGILCATCLRWAHFSCSGASLKVFNSNIDWICNACLMNELPKNIDVLNCDNDEGSVSQENVIDQSLTISHHDPEVIFQHINTHPGLNIAHLNVCSLLKNLDEIRFILKTNKIHVLCLSETRLDQSVNDDEIHVEGYTNVRLDRNRNGGGIIAYIHESVTFKHIKDLADNNLELSCIEICTVKQKPFLLINWYRPPDSHIDVFDKIEVVLENVEIQNTDYVFVGDMNCDLNKLPPAHHTKRLLQIAEEHELKQFVEKPTRITSTTSTLIDVLFSTNSEKISFCDVVPLSLSDHFMVVATWGNTKPPSGNHKYVVSRNVKKLREDEFIRELQQVSWNNVLDETDVENAYEQLVSTLNSILDKHIPLRKRRVRQKETPWMNNDIITKIRERDKMKKQARKSGSELHWNMYKKLRNKVTSMTRTAKRLYVTKMIRDNKGNPSAMWKSLRCVLPNKKKNTSISKLVVSGKEVTGYKNIATHLNDHFTNIANKRKNTQKFGNNMEQFLQKCSSVFKFHDVSEEDVLKHVNAIPSNKATGLDNIPASILKISINHILRPLTHLINLSLKNGIVPRAWKLARITPLHKGGDPTNVSHYRPISVLPVLSKVLEKVVFQQVIAYLIENDLLCSQQHGFRPKHSTSTAVINVIEDIVCVIDKGYVVGLISLDLEKAFDLISHNILLKKLNFYGFDDNAIRWFRHYLYQRRQITVVNGNESVSSYVQCGVPQGSILGPLLFILFLNDLPKVVEKSSLSLYADDTCVYFASKNPQELQNVLNKDLSLMANWFSHNHLILNIKKCNYMILGSNAKLRSFTNLTLCVNNTELERVYQCKYLGVIIDCNLTWSKQIDSVRLKAIRNLHLLKRARSFIDKQTALTLYHTLIQSHLDYCSTIWMNGHSVHLKRLQVIQNRALRIVLQVDNRFNRQSLYDTLKVDCLLDRWKKQALLLIFKVLNNLLPVSLCERVQKRESLYNLRNHENILNLPKPKTNILRKSTLYSASKLFNTLPTRTRSITSITAFSKSISHLSFANHI